MKKLLLPLMLLTLFTSCITENKLKEMLKKDPTILTDAIKANPDKFIEALNDAVKVAQKKEQAKRAENEKKQLEDSFNNPLVPQIRDDELIRGTKGAPIVLVEYSDFECPFCSRGFKTVQQLLKSYEGQIQFIYKHLPLSFHPQAMIASKYYEAMRIQSHDKAIKFHDAIYENQKKLQNGEKFLKALAKKLGANMSKLAKDVKSDAVAKRVKEDMAEAAKYNFQGTPGFLLNGVPVKGAYPYSHFENIINELKKRGKIKI